MVFAYKILIKQYHGTGLPKKDRGPLGGGFGKG